MLLSSGVFTTGDFVLGSFSAMTSFFSSAFSITMSYLIEDFPASKNGVLYIETYVAGRKPPIIATISTSNLTLFHDHRFLPYFLKSYTNSIRIPPPHSNPSAAHFPYLYIYPPLLSLLHTTILLPSYLTPPLTLLPPY